MRRSIINKMVTEEQGESGNLFLLTIKCCERCDSGKFERGGFSLIKWFKDLHEAWKSDGVEARGAVPEFKPIECQFCKQARVKVTVLW